MNDLSQQTISELDARTTRGPSAFAASEIRIDQFVDLDEFPIHDLSNPRREKLVQQCRADLQRVGCSHLENFIRLDAVDEMRREATRLFAQARPADDRINPYLLPEDDSLPADHPKRFFQTRTSSFINSDLLEQHSLLRKIYDCDVLVHFFADCLNLGPIYRWADPLGRNPYSVMQDGNYFPWHFDGNDFTVSILVQQSEGGGVFEYCPNIRCPQQENFDAVKSVLQGDRNRVMELPLNEGDLQLFMGRYSLHRVTPAVGSTPRIIALPTYVTNPYLVNRPHHAKAFYGRSLEIHQQRDMPRQDNLAD